MLSLPTVNPLALHVAVPPLSVAVPSVDEPLRNVTVPAGMPDPAAGVTVAVNVIACPLAAGFRDEVSVVVVPNALVLMSTPIEPSAQSVGEMLH